MPPIFKNGDFSKTDKDTYLMIFKPFFDTILKVKRDNKEESMDYKTELIKNKLSEMESHVNDSNDASLKNEFYELKNLISSKLDNVKYGLVFEESKEDIEIKCETMIPYLERERDKRFREEW